MSQFGRRGVLVLLGLLFSTAAHASPPGAVADTQSVESAVLAASAEMTKAAEAADADRLFSYIAETDKGSVIQNGVLMATRQEALERVRANLSRTSRVRYRWNRQYVTVLSPEIAVLAADGEVTATTAAGDTFTAPLAQTIVFALKDGRWTVVHAHQSSPR